MKPFLISLFIGVLCFYTKAQNAPTTYGTGAGTNGRGSSYFGYEAGHSVLHNGGKESYNCFFGEACGRETTTGIGNTGMGYQALQRGTYHSGNTAIGYRSLTYTTEGSNTAVGFYTLGANTTGYFNSALGSSAMRNNLTGVYNVAIGTAALSANRDGNENTAVGARALHYSVGARNTAVGYNSGNKNEMGTHNTTAGYDAMSKNTSGHFNSAFGVQSLANNITGSLNSAFGTHAGPSTGELTNTTTIGFSATATASNQVRLGNTYVTSIGGKVSWSTLSDGRFKRDVKDDVPGLSFIQQLRPVSYTFDEKALGEFFRIPDSLRLGSIVNQSERQSGFIAQEVETMVRKKGFAFHGIETPQNAHDHYAIRYSEFVVPLVKAVQELSMEIESLKARLAVAEKNSDPELTKAPVLFQNTPNPFSSDTEIHMSLPDESQNAVLTIYNLEGKQLKKMSVNDRGPVVLKIMANEMSPGMYLYTLIVDGKMVDTKRMILTDH